MVHAIYLVDYYANALGCWQIFICAQSSFSAIHSPAPGINCAAVKAGIESRVGVMNVYRYVFAVSRCTPFFCLQCFVFVVFIYT